MTEVRKEKRWVIVRLRISKGDVCGETDIETWDDEEKARNALESYRCKVSPAWPDWDDYDISVRDAAETEPTS